MEKEKPDFKALLYEVADVQKTAILLKGDLIPLVIYDSKENMVVPPLYKEITESVPEGMAAAIYEYSGETIKAILRDGKLEVIDDMFHSAFLESETTGSLESMGMSIEGVKPSISPEEIKVETNKLLQSLGIKEVK